MVTSATFVMVRTTCVFLVGPPARALWSGVFLDLVSHCVTIKTSRRTPCPRQGLPPRLPGLTKLLNMRPGPRKAPKVTPRQPGPDPQEGYGAWGSSRQNKTRPICRVSAPLEPNYFIHPQFARRKYRSRMAFSPLLYFLHGFYEFPSQAFLLDLHFLVGVVVPA